MGILLLLLGVLAVASGALKLRARARTLVGRSPFAIAEFWAGTLTVIASALGLSRMRPLAWLVVLGVSGLIAVASVSHIRSIIDLERRRQASREARLETFLKSEDR